MEDEALHGLGLLPQLGLCLGPAIVREDEVAGFVHMLKGVVPALEGSPEKGRGPLGVVGQFRLGGKEAVPVEIYAIAFGA